MSTFKAVSAVGAALLSASTIASAATDADIADLRREIQVLKQEYEARIRALEQRLQETERGAGASPSGSSGAIAPPPTTEVAAQTAPSAPATSGIAAFNPALSLVLQGAYANLSRDPVRHGLQGFQKIDEISPGPRGLSIAESELTFSANVDDRFAGVLTVAVTPDNSLSVEEAYGFMPSLASGVVPKFGRFLSGIGYLNEQHQHAWDFYDAPLAYDVLLGGQYRNDGAQVKWVAPIDEFVELGAEIGNGGSFPGTQRNRNGIGAASIFAHAGGDIGASHSWRAGVSYLETRAQDRAATTPDVAGALADVAFTGKSRVAIADFVWKYAPNGNATRTSFKLQGEYLWRREGGDLTFDPGGVASTSSYSSSQRGWYLQSVWQFEPAWRVGARYDRVDAGRPSYGANADILDVAAFHPQRLTAMLDWSPSEFTRWRLQLAQARTRPGETDNQLYLQYLLTLGAHGAHRF